MITPIKITVEVLETLSREEQDSVASRIVVGLNPSLTLWDKCRVVITTPNERADYMANSELRISSVTGLPYSARYLVRGMTRTRRRKSTRE